MTGVPVAAEASFLVMLLLSARFDARIDALTTRMDEHLGRHAS